MGLIILICMCIYAIYKYLFKTVDNIESFTPQSERDFLLSQHTINKDTVFDMDVINSQASQAELDYFNQHGMWPWSPKVIELYTSAVSHNPYIRTVPAESTLYARRLYNEAAIIRVLTYQSKEGQFLLNGISVDDPLLNNNNNMLSSGFGSFPYTSGLIKEDNTKDTIMCNLSTMSLERIKGVNVTPVDYHQLENIIPGFHFLDKPCNPCTSMAANPDYSCAYSLSSTTISDIWQYLWNKNTNK